MAIKRICKYGEDILRKKLPPCDYAKIKDGLPALLKDMWDTLEAVRGVGLAANQIGVELRLSVIALPDEKNKKPRKIVIINPEIVEGAGRMFEEEGCLSLPGLFSRLARFSKVRVRALDENGEGMEVTCSGLAAKAFQHEIDHLDGKLFVDRLTGLSKIKAKAEIKASRKEWAAMDESKPEPGRTNRE